MAKEEMEPKNKPEENSEIPQNQNEPLLSSEQIEDLEEQATQAGENESPEAKDKEINELKEGIEGQFELPTKEEIFNLLGIDIEKCTIEQEKSDGGSLYRLDFKTEDGNEYMYCRTGKFEGTHEFSTTEIIETTPTTWPTPIYRYENGGWKKV